MTHPFAHLPTEFVGFSRYSNAAPDIKVHGFLKKFGAPSDASDYHPLLLVENYSKNGEFAHSFGLFVKDGRLFEVNGCECALWSFKGRWEPEETTSAALGAGITRDEYSQFAEPLRAILEWVDSTLQKQVLLNTLPPGATANSAPKKI